MSNCEDIFHRFSNQQIVYIIINRDRSRVGQLIREWAPKWANVGIDLAILDITTDYLRKKKNCQEYTNGKGTPCNG